MNFSALIDRVAALATLLRLFVYDTQNANQPVPNFHAAEVAGGAVIIRVDDPLAALVSTHLFTVAQRLDFLGLAVRATSQSSSRQTFVRLELNGRFTGYPVSVVVQASGLEALRLHQALAKRYDFFEHVRPSAVGLSLDELKAVVQEFTADCEHGARWTDSCSPCDAAAADANNTAVQA